MKKELTISEAGKLGGEMTFKRHGRDHYVKMGKKSRKNKARKLLTGKLAK